MNSLNNLEHGSIHPEDINISINLMNLEFKIILYDSFLQSGGISFTSSHSHPAYEVHITTDGEGSMQLDSSEVILSAGSLCIIAPCIYHTQKLTSEKHIQKSCFRFQYRELKKESPSPYETDIIKNILTSMRFIHIKDANESFETIRKIKQELISQQFGYITKVEILFGQLLLDIFRTILAKSETADTRRLDQISKNTKKEERNSTIDSFFEKNYMCNTSLQMLADTLHLSPRQAEREVAKLYGVSFKQVLLQARLAIAMDLLKNTSMTVNIISEKLGYCSPSKFSHIFKSRIGMTPEEYKKFRSI